MVFDVDVDVDVGSLPNCGRSVTAGDGFEKRCVCFARRILESMD